MGVFTDGVLTMSNIIFVYSWGKTRYMPTEFAFSFNGQGGGLPLPPHHPLWLLEEKLYVPGCLWHDVNHIPLGEEYETV